MKTSYSIPKNIKFGNLNFQSSFPVLVYVRFPSDTDHRYFYAKWTGTEWIDREIVRYQLSLLMFWSC